ncbi:MAG: hypothetical protein ACOC3V_05760 [bacterium]
MDKIYFQVIGPDENKNQEFIEKMSNKKYSLLNDFRTTTEKVFDSNAYKNYLVFTKDLDLPLEQEIEWMDFYHSNNSIDWVREF